MPNAADPVPSPGGSLTAQEAHTPMFHFTQIDPDLYEVRARAIAERPELGRYIDDDGLGEAIRGIAWISDVFTFGAPGLDTGWPTTFVPSDSPVCRIDAIHALQTALERIEGYKKRYEACEDAANKAYTDFIDGPLFDGPLPGAVDTLGGASMAWWAGRIRALLAEEAPEFERALGALRGIEDELRAIKADVEDGEYDLPTVEPTAEDLLEGLGMENLTITLFTVAGAYEWLIKLEREALELRAGTNAGADFWKTLADCRGAIIRAADQGSPGTLEEFQAEWGEKIRAAAGDVAARLRAVADLVEGTVR